MPEQGHEQQPRRRENFFTVAMRSEEFGKLKESTQDHVRRLGMRADEILQRFGVQTEKELFAFEPDPEVFDEYMELLDELKIILSQFLKSLRLDCIVGAYERIYEVSCEETSRTGNFLSTDSGVVYEDKLNITDVGTLRTDKGEQIDYGQGIKTHALPNGEWIYERAYDGTRDAQEGNSQFQTCVYSSEQELLFVCDHIIKQFEIKGVSYFWVQVGQGVSEIYDQYGNDFGETINPVRDAMQFADVWEDQGRLCALLIKGKGVGTGRLVKGDQVQELDHLSFVSNKGVVFHEGVPHFIHYEDTAQGREFLLKSDYGELLARFPAELLVAFAPFGNDGYLMALNGEEGLHIIYADKQRYQEIRKVRGEDCSFITEGGKALIMTRDYDWNNEESAYYVYNQNGREIFAEEAVSVDLIKRNGELFFQVFDGQNVEQAKMYDDEGFHMEGRSIQLFSFSDLDGECEWVYDPFTAEQEGGGVRLIRGNWPHGSTYKDILLDKTLRLKGISYFVTVDKKQDQCVVVDEWGEEKLRTPYMIERLVVNKEGNMEVIAKDTIEDSFNERIHVYELSVA